MPLFSAKGYFGWPYGSMWFSVHSSSSGNRAPSTRSLLLCDYRRQSSSVSSSQMDIILSNHNHTWLCLQKESLSGLPLLLLVQVQFTSGKIRMKLPLQWIVPVSSLTNTCTTAQLSSNDPSLMLFSGVPLMLQQHFTYVTWCLSKSSGFCGT